MDPPDAPHSSIVDPSSFISSLQHAAPIARLSEHKIQGQPGPSGDATSWSKVVVVKSVTSCTTKATSTLVGEETPEQHPKAPNQRQPSLEVSKSRPFAFDGASDHPAEAQRPHMAFTLEEIPGGGERREYEASAKLPPHAEKRGWCAIPAPDDELPEPPAKRVKLNATFDPETSDGYDADDEKEGKTTLV